MVAREVNLFPLGHRQITGLSTVKTLAFVGAVATDIPEGAKFALVQATDNNIRWTDDGVDPTISTGIQLASGNDIWVPIVQLIAFKMLEEAASAKVNVAFYSETQVDQT